MRFTDIFEWEQQAAIEFAHVDINVKLAFVTQPGQPLRPEAVERFVASTNSEHSTVTLCGLLRLLKTEVASLAREIDRQAAFDEHSPKGLENLLSAEGAKSARLVQLTTTLQAYLEEIAFIRQCLTIRLEQEASLSVP